MSISAPRGLKPPPLQTAGKQDGGGNGSGGMFMGGGQQEPGQEDSSQQYYPQMDPDDVLNSAPQYHPMVPAADKTPMIRLKEWAATMAYRFLQEPAPPVEPHS